MSASGYPLALDELSWVDAAAHLAHNPRLIIPVGALDQHGPHLPLGSNVLIARRLTVDLSEEFDTLRAPTVNYGVHARGGPTFAGTASLTEKTLHRALNELLDAWERSGVGEFILITAHRYDPHLEALATLVTRRARVRVVQVWDVDIADLLEGQPGVERAGEAETSLMLHLYPELVRMDRARDYVIPPDRLKRYLHGESPIPPPGSGGVVGQPTLATPAKGERLYARILETVRRSLFLRKVQESDTL
ncbi:MAG TPA: creatininase family protein [Longimicrobiales bacterium]|nr:creatininase family protein [Longimicrobiales bacterium]